MKLIFKSRTAYMLWRQSYLSFYHFVPRTSFSNRNLNKGHSTPKKPFANVTDPSEAQFDFVFISVFPTHWSKQAALDVWRSNSNGVIRRWYHFISTCSKQVTRAFESWHNFVFRTKEHRSWMKDVRIKLRWKSAFTSCPLPGFSVHSPWPLAQSQDLVVSLAPDGSDNYILSNRWAQLMSH